MQKTCIWKFLNCYGFSCSFFSLAMLMDLWQVISCRDTFISPTFPTIPNGFLSKMQGAQKFIQLSWLIPTVSGKLKHFQLIYNLYIRYNTSWLIWPLHCFWVACDGTTGQSRGARGLMLRWNSCRHKGLLDSLVVETSTKHGSVKQREMGRYCEILYYVYWGYYEAFHW